MTGAGCDACHVWRMTGAAHMIHESAAQHIICLNEEIIYCSAIAFLDCASNKTANRQHYSDALPVLSIEDVFLSERKYAEDYARSAINYIAAPEKSLRVMPASPGTGGGGTIG